MTLKVFVIGATGFIGGTALTRLLQSPDWSKKYTITVLLRDSSRSSLYTSLGLSTLTGSLDDSDLLTTTSSESDIVLNFADADHLPGTQAILAGLQKT